MRYKVFLIATFLIVFSGSLKAKEIAVKIKPACKITTSNLDLKEGDLLDFVISEDVYIKSSPYLKKDEKVTGLVTNLEDNNYLSQPAKIHIENFRTVDVKNSPVKLNGIIYKSGNDHHVLGEFVFFEYLRGGEVQINPEKDEFILYIEENL